MAIITNNFLAALGESLVRTDNFYEMQFGSGTGTVAQAISINTLFTREYPELISTVGNSSSSTRFNNAVDVIFSVLIDGTQGNGTGTVNYRECGLFDQLGNKLTHVLFSAPVVKDNTKAITFKYVMSLGQK